MNDEHLRFRVAQHVTDFIRACVPVQRHRIGADGIRRMGRFEEGKIVSQQQGDSVIFAHAEPGKSAGRPARPRQKLGFRTDTFADNDGRGVAFHLPPRQQVLRPA
jgi:hypothetical protein